MLNDVICIFIEGVHAIPMTEDMFESWVEAHHYTFINFYAPWCVWCQRLEPVWEALAEKIESDDLPVSIVKVDCVANQNLCMQQRIQVLPQPVLRLEVLILTQRFKDYKKKATFISLGPVSYKSLTIPLSRSSTHTGLS